MVGVIYPIHNRKEYVEITLPALLHECKNSPVFGDIVIIDDMSNDGATEVAVGMVESAGVEYNLWTTKIGNSQLQWNIADAIFGDGITHLANFTNENWIPQGTLQSLHKWFLHPHYKGNLLTVGANCIGDGYPRIETVNEWVKEVESIGNGMMCRELFNKHGGIKKLDRFSGFGKYQRDLPYKKLIDMEVNAIQLDKSPIYSRAHEYAEKGWGRMLHAHPNPILKK